MSEPIAIVAAMQSELSGFKKLVNVSSSVQRKAFFLTEAEFKSKKILLLQTGMGLVNAREAISYLLEHYSPRIILSTGFAGATLSDQRSGDLVLAKALATNSKKKDPLISIAGEWLGKIEKMISESRFRSGTFLTVDRPIDSPEEKGRLAEQTGAVALEMETYEIGRQATAKGVPFLGLRSIFDTVSMKLPEPNLFLHEDQELSYEKLTRLVVSQPWLLLSLPKFAKAYRQASKSLTNFLGNFVRDL